MNYEEFTQFTLLNNNSTDLARHYALPDGSMFYIEPIFYTQLTRYLERFPLQQSAIIDEMVEVVTKNRQVVFSGNYEFPLINVEGYLYREITDITNKLKIYVNDISRGSDYGD